MSPTDAHALALTIRAARESRGLSLRRLAETAGINRATLIGLERAEIPTPQPDTLILLAHALDIHTADLFAVAGWLPADQLPDLGPYLRDKYRELDDGQIADVEHYVAHVRSTCVCPNKTTAS